MRYICNSVIMYDKDIDFNLLDLHILLYLLDAGMNAEDGIYGAWQDEARLKEEREVQTQTNICEIQAQYFLLWVKYRRDNYVPETPEQSTDSELSEIEPDRSEEEEPAPTGDVKASEPHPNDQENGRDDSSPVVVQFLEKVDPCLLAQFAVSGCVKKELVLVNSVKVSRSGLE